MCIPQHFILLDVIVSGIIPLIYLSKLLLLIYKYSTDFSVNFINFVSFSLPNSLMSSSYFMIVSLGFSMYRTISSANSESFTSSFPIWIPFISFSALIAVAKTSKTMLNSNGESGHPCLVPDFRGNAFNFSPLR